MKKILVLLLLLLMTISLCEAKELIGFHLVCKHNQADCTAILDQNGEILYIEKENYLSVDNIHKAEAEVSKFLETDSVNKKIKGVKDDFYYDHVELTITLTDIGAVEFAKITGENIGRRVVVLIDGEFQIAPVINERIIGGKVIISSGGTYEEAEVLAKKINKAIKKHK